MKLKILITSRENIFSSIYRQILSQLKVESEFMLLDELLNQHEIIDQYDGLIISSSSGHPDQKEYIDLFNQYKRKLPILGVGLGMQIIVCALGGSVVKAQQPLYGVPNLITHHNKGIFTDLPKEFKVVRYHSFVTDKNTFPSSELMVSASAIKDKSIMAIKHRVYPIEGVQFNPESIATDYGLELFEAYIRKIIATKVCYT